MKRASKLHEANRLFEVVMPSDLDLMRGKSQMDELPDYVDGIEGKQEVANKFHEVYEELYVLGNGKYK